MKYFSITFLLAGIHFSLWSQPAPSIYYELEKNYNANAFEACVQMEKQVELFTRNRIDTLAANSFFYLGDAYNQLGELKKALAYFEREKSILSSLGMAYISDYSNSLSNLAYLYLQDGNYTRAGQAADELLLTDRKLFSPQDDPFIQSVLYISDIYLQLDRLRDAENILSHALKAQHSKSLNRGLLLNKLGDLYSYTGQYSKASHALMEAVDLLAEGAGEESPEYISTAINLGILYMNQGKYPQAEEIFDVALSKVNRSETAYASVLNNQALVFQSLGQLDRAEKTLQEIKKTDSVEVGTSHPDYAVTLSNLALVYGDLGKFSEAELTLKKALDIQAQNQEGHTLSYARKLNNLAKIHQMAGSPEKSIPLLQNALTIFKRTMGRKSAEYATATYNLGLAYWKSGKGATGYKYLKTSAAIRAKVLGKNHPRYAESLLKMGEYQWYKKSVIDARRSFGDVFENYYFQIDETFPVLTEEEKTRFYYTNIRGAFDKFNSFAVSHQHEEPALLNDVYDYLINTKGSIMLATEKVRRSIMTSGDSTLIGQFELWQASKEQIAKSYSLNQENPQLDSLLTSSNHLEKEVARRSADFAGQFIREKTSWKEIQKSLKEGEAAVEVLRFKNYSPEAGGEFTEEVRYAFLAVTSETKDQPAIILLGEGNHLESKYLRYYLNNIKYKLTDEHSYRHYFEPLAEYLRKEKVSRVYLSPDGVYNLINVNSIQNPSSKQFLIDEFDIRFVTNTRELTETTIRRNDHQSSVLIGFPKFNLDTTELHYHHPIKTTSRAGNLTRTWRGGLLRYMRGEEGISQLPGTQVEIDKIARLFGATSSVFTTDMASESVTKKVNSPTILHIATHGYFLEDEKEDVKKSAAPYMSSPLLNAGLMLAGAENFLKTGEPLNENGDDGILTAFEALNLNLDGTELVVLSACETALGDVKNGEGVYGLQRAFKLAGARNIVMSLWNVDDQATQELMTTFYAEMIRTNDQHQAFRTAQRQVKEKYPSPFYWAAFIMVGI